MRNQPLYSQDLTLVLERCVFSHVCSWTIPSCRHMCALYVRVLQNTNSQFLWSFSRPVTFRSMAEFGERLWRFREGYSHTYEPPQSSHFYPATKYNFTHFPASKYFYLPCCLWENMHLVTTGKINLQRRKSSGMRHENHMDFFFPFSLILPPSLSLPALCQLIKSREQVRGLSWSCCLLIQGHDCVDKAKYNVYPRNGPNAVCSLEHLWVWLDDKSQSSTRNPTFCSCSLIVLMHV